MVQGVATVQALSVCWVSEYLSPWHQNSTELTPRAFGRSLAPVPGRCEQGWLPATALPGSNAQAHSGVPLRPRCWDTLSLSSSLLRTYHWHRLACTDQRCLKWGTQLDSPSGEGRTPATALPRMATETKGRTIYYSAIKYANRVC